MACDMMISVLLLVSLIGVSLGTVTQCYQCGSALTKDSKCSDDNVKSNYKSTTCPGGTTYNYCGKTSVSGGFIWRACLPVCVESDVLKCCDSDGCNGTTSVTVNLVGVVVALIAGVVFTKVQ